jgi:hypothetical protein
MEKPEWSDDGNERPVYRIPLSSLYYNDDNGRIATWISSYDETHPLNPLSSLNRDNYNKVIEAMIIKSGKPGTFEKTKKDIFGKGQLRPGLILTDGRVVDGNRRFTVLRTIYRENPTLERFGYFECFVENAPADGDENAWKKIKRIERKAQFDIDEKVDYDPIEKLVEAYNDLVAEDHLLTPKEYKDIYHMKDGDVRDMQEKAEIMVDYLDFFNLHNKFHVVRARKLDGPINELVRLYRKVDKTEWVRIRPLFYVEMYEENKGGDRTRLIRDLMKTYSDDSQRDTFNNLLDRVNKELETQQFSEEPGKETNVEPTSDGQSSTDNAEKTVEAETGSTEPPVLPKGPSLSGETGDSINKIVQRTKERLARRKPVSQADDAYKALNDIDLGAVRNMSAADREDLKNSLEKLRGALSTIEEILK